MTKKISDGGPAFPHHIAIVKPDGTFVMLREYGLCESGMSLLDWFAGRALANSSYVAADQRTDVLAVQCYDVAEAMMDERDFRESRRKMRGE